MTLCLDFRINHWIVKKLENKCKNFSFSVQPKTWRIYLSYSITHRKLFYILQVLFIAQRRKRYLYIDLKNSIGWGEGNCLIALSFSEDFAILIFFCYLSPALPQLLRIRFRTLVTVLFCVNPICLPSLFKTAKTVFYFPNKLLGKMRSFGNGIKSNVIWKKWCVQFRCPLGGTHFTVTPFISGNLLQTYLI